MGYKMISTLFRSFVTILILLLFSITVSQTNHPVYVTFALYYPVNSKFSQKTIKTESKYNYCRHLLTNGMAATEGRQTLASRSQEVSLSVFA